jgi:hypothetical protein
MQLIDSIVVDVGGRNRQVRLCMGDLVHLPADEAVDVLVVSAFPGDYSPLPGTLIGALSDVGVSVDLLSRDKAVDLRQFSACWLSHPIARDDLHITRVMCFEPAIRGKAPEVAGDLFRSIIPLAGGDPPIRRVAMSLLAAGDQGEEPLVMLEALADASAQWLSHGLDLDAVTIVVRPKWAGSLELRRTFGGVKEKYAPSPAPRFAFDAFVSYSHVDKDDVDALTALLQERRPDVRLFVDRLELNPGAAWQQHIFESLDRSRTVISVLSPDYLTSKVCVEEFNMALFRHRESKAVLLPLYLRSADLPTYIQMVQWLDAREADPVALASAAETLAARLSASG